MNNRCGTNSALKISFDAYVDDGSGMTMSYTRLITRYYFGLENLN